MGSWWDLASHAGVVRVLVFHPSLQGGRDERRAPLNACVGGYVGPRSHECENKQARILLIIVNYVT